jgi:hypothetical protein
MTENERESREYRKHDDYKEDHWRVLDVDGVDKVFATVAPDRRDESVRVDLDGFIVDTPTNDLGGGGENVNTSLWLPLPEAVELRDHLDEAIEEARDRQREQAEQEGADDS